MKILAVDQARNGGWAVFDHEQKKLLKYGDFGFSKVKSFEEILPEIVKTVDGLISNYEVDVVVIEDIQYQKNLQSFKKLAWLQGSLVAWFVHNEYCYEIVAPTKWQSWCGCTNKVLQEIKATHELKKGERATKIFSVQKVKELFGVDTVNSDTSDSILIGWWAVNNIHVEDSKNGED